MNALIFTATRVPRGPALALALALGVAALPPRGGAQAGDTTAQLNLQDDAIRAESGEQWDEAVRIHKIRAIAAPMEADIWMRISDVEIRRGDTNAALEAMEQAVRVSPSNALFQARLSQGYAMANRPKNAFDSMERAVALDPTNTAYLLSRAELANWIGKPLVAADSCERLLRMNPNAPDALLLLARTRMWQGKLDASASAYRKYLRAHPDKAEVYLEYAKVEAWRGNFARSIEILDRYGKKFGDKPKVDREQARAYASADKPSKAMALNEPLLKESLDDFDLQFTRAVALHYDNQPRAAKETVSTLSKLRPDSVEVEGIRSFVEATRRPYARIGGRYYTDNDELRISHGEISAGVPIRPETWVLAGLDANELRASKGSGLENADGRREAEHRKGWIGLRHIFFPSLWGEGRVGRSEVLDADERYVYAVEAGARPFDSVRLTLARDLDYLLISPRSASLGVERTTSRLAAQWEPDLLYTVVGSLRYDDLSDDNVFREAVLAPRRSVLRSDKFNVDLGVRGIWSGYSQDLNSGYYDPDDYEQYTLNGFGYWKISGGCGLGLILSGGCYKDDTMDTYRFGWAADTELTLGAFSDWMFKVSGHAMENLRESAGDSFQAYAISASLARRF